jgi:hypothetical protein
LNSGEDQPGQHFAQVKAAIKAVLVFTEVSVRIFLEIEGMIGARDGRLQIAKNGINPGEAFHLGAFAILADYVLLVQATGFRYRV